MLPDNHYPDDNPYASPVWPAAPPAPRTRGKYRAAATLAFCCVLLLSAAAVWLPVMDLPIDRFGALAGLMVQALAARVLVLTLEFLPAAIVLRWWSSLGQPAEEPSAPKASSVDRGVAIGGSIGIVLSAVPMTLCLLLDAATLFSADPAMAASVARMLFLAVFALGFVGACIGGAVGAVLGGARGG